MRGIEPKPWYTFKDNSSFLLLSLIQDKVAQELFSVFGASDRCPTINDISQLKYLESVIKESLRLCPPVPVIGRTLSEDVLIGKKK